MRLESEPHERLYHLDVVLSALINVDRSILCSSRKSDGGPPFKNLQRDCQVAFRTLTARRTKAPLILHDQPPAGDISMIEETHWPVTAHELNTYAAAAAAANGASMISAEASFNLTSISLS